MYKRIIALVIIAILFSGTGFAFAYWDDFTKEETATLNIGYGVALIVEAEATVPEGKILVPPGESVRVNDIEEVVLTYIAKTDQEIMDGLYLLITVDNILIGSQSTYSDLVNINIEQSSNTVNNSDVLVTITITINEPSSYEIYSQIMNQNISFQLTFEATKTLN